MGKLTRIFTPLREGDRWTRLSLFAWCSGYFARGQRGKGLLLILLQAAMALVLVLLAPTLMKLPTLGSVQAERIYDPVVRQNVWNDYDNSFLILLGGVVGLLTILLMVWFSLRFLRGAYRLQQSAQEGRHIAAFREEAGALWGRRFHITLLAVPVLGVTVFTLLPLIVMVLIAFTNYDRNHMVPTNLFTWVGLDNFRSLTGLSAGGSFGYALRIVLGWTLIWAVLATLSCFILGLLLAMLIGHKSTRFKPFWRVCFMIAMAVPQFVSLLLIRNMFADVGIVNTICKSIGLTDWLHSIGAIPTPGVIPFLTNPVWARPTILLINIWVGVPYQLLIATGVLLNIPPALTEAARIDGANAWQSFRHITMPYVLFVTGPSLVSALVSNINNFGVIWLLTRDVYTTSDQLLAGAGATEVDLLVTWLYRLTQDQSNYKMASVIGILVFVICSVLTLIAFRRLTGSGREETFQ